MNIIYWLGICYGKISLLDLENEGIGHNDSPLIRNIHTGVLNYGTFVQKVMQKCI